MHAALTEDNALKSLHMHLLLVYITDIACMFPDCHENCELVIGVPKAEFWCIRHVTEDYLRVLFLEMYEDLTAGDAARFYAAVDTLSI